MSAPAEPNPAPARRHRLLLIGSVVYLALIFGVMLWRGVSIEPEWVLLVLLVLAVALGRGRTFSADWTPGRLPFLALGGWGGCGAEGGRGRAGGCNAPEDVGTML